ncbi:MAG: dihydrofolate reductase [Pseudomonadota bacterium]
MDIVIVVAVAKNGVIGMDGGMPWRLSTDLKRFKVLTLGKPMIMGRKTFESIGKPLPGRTSIVVTRDTEWQSPGVVAIDDLDKALTAATEIATADGVSEICVVGGGEIYRQTLDRATRLCVTEVDAEPEGDTTFPPIDDAQWIMVFTETVPPGERDTAATTYRVYERRA